MRTGKTRYGLTVFLTAAAVTASQLWSWAAAPFVSWQKGSRGNQAEVSVSLAGGDDLPGGVSALQLGFRLEADNGGDIQEASFAFDSQIRQEASITIKDYVYDEEEGLLTIFAAGNDITLLEAGKTKKLGTVTAKSTEDVLIYPVEAEIAGDGEKKSIDLGDEKANGWTLKASEKEPDGPEDPTDPSDPSKPSDPSDPADPTDPSNPDGPSDPSDPSRPEGPADPSNPADPTDPSNPGDSADPSDPSNPADPADPSDPEDPSDPSNPSNPSISGRPGRGGGSGSSGRSSGIVYLEPFPLAQETAGTWEWTGTVWRFKLRSGVYARNSWIYVKGEWYHMDQNGEMNTLWYQTPAGAWYYLAHSGAMKRGWIELEGVRYHLDMNSGKMDTGWFYCDNNWFYAYANGAMTTGWQMINEKWYYLNPVRPVPVQVRNPETGQMEESVEGQRLYGAMYAGEATPDGLAVDANGVRQ